jgi:hypothetical protein
MKESVPMATLSVIRARADELRHLPHLTPLRLFRILSREFPHAERDFLVRAARLEGHPRGVTPGWGRLHPVVARWQPKGRPEEPVIKTERKVVAVNYPEITIEARELRATDWLVGHGLMKKLGNYGTMIMIWLYDGTVIHFSPREHVRVRLEDRGETS